jgi:hypothetical protein
MNPDGPTAVAVTLHGGPCDGQIVNVWPLTRDEGPNPAGTLPYAVEAMQPADQRDDAFPELCTYTYLRDGDPAATRRYVYWRDVTPRA